MQWRTKLRILLLIAVAFVTAGRIIVTQARASAETFVQQNSDTVSSTSNPAIAPAPPANSSNMVWVNLGSGAYYKPGSRYYGKTKRGKYMLEADAIRAGYHSASKK